MSVSTVLVFELHGTKALFEDECFGVDLAGGYDGLLDEIAEVLTAFVGWEDPEFVEQAFGGIGEDVREPAFDLAFRGLVFLEAVLGTHPLLVYERKEDVEHLHAAISEFYDFKLDWEGKQHVGIALDWNYSLRTLKCSMPGYVEAALAELSHEFPTTKCYAPSRMIRPVYGQRLQFAHIDDAEPLTPAEIKLIQKITGKFLYYARAIDNTMLHSLNNIATQTINGTKTIMEAVQYFLNYCASNPNTVIMFRATDMILRIDSDGAHLVAPKARSRAGGYHFLGDINGIAFNAPIYVLAKVLKHVTASAAETEIGALYLNAREATVFRQTLHDMGHPQPATPIKTDNTTARGIIDETMKAKYLKGADMRLNWMKDRVEQEQFYVYWEPAETNLGDHPTKHHSPTHHRLTRPIHTYDPVLSPSTLQGCVNILKSLAANRPASHDNEPAELTSRTLIAPRATNITDGTKRVGRKPIQTPRKMQSIAKRPLPSHPFNEHVKDHPIGSPTKFATKNIRRLSPPDGANNMTPKFALKSIRRQ